MQHFLSFHLSYYKPHSACVYFRASFLQHPLLCPCPIYTETIHLPRPLHGLCQPVFASLCLFLALPHFSFFISQAIPVCIPPLASQNPKSMPSSSPAHPGSVSSPVCDAGGCLASAPSVCGMCCVARGSWHQHLPLALELQAMMVIPRCFKHVNSCCCHC